MPTATDRNTTAGAGAPNHPRLRDRQSASPSCRTCIGRMICRWRIGKHACAVSLAVIRNSGSKISVVSRSFPNFEVNNPASGSTYRVAIRGERPGENFCSCPDFATNTLGTCKHIEFTLADLGKHRAAACGVCAGFQPAYSEIVLQYGAAARSAIP